MAREPLFESLKGFRDFYPEEMTARRHIFDTAEDVVRSFGYRQVDGPSVESLDLFRLKSGDEVVEQTYSFTDKGGRDVTLIPELTPTVARMVAARAKTMPKPIKWYSWGKMWRYEQPQSGRLREFYQLNVDCFGSSRPEADAEVLAMGAKIMLELGLDGEFLFKVNSRMFMERLLNGLDVPPDRIAEAFTIVDKHRKISGEEIIERISELGLKSKKFEIFVTNLGGEVNLGEGPYLSQLLESGMEGYEIFKKNLDYYRELAGQLESYGLDRYFQIDVSVVRGLDYYTDLVFECFDKKGELRSLFGGGRYDGVVELFGGPPTPAVGFAMGDAVLEVLMRRAGKWPQRGMETDYYVVWVGQEQRPLCLKIAGNLRDRGNVVETDVMGKNVGKQMSYANYIGAKKVLLVGDEEKAKKVVTVRDMSTGQQAEEPLVKYLGELT